MATWTYPDRSLGFMDKARECVLGFVGSLGEFLELILHVLSGIVSTSVFTDSGVGGQHKSQLNTQDSPEISQEDI